MLQDLELLESGSILKGLRFPHKIEKVTQIVITAGQFSCLVDFRMWSLKAPAVALFLPGQVVESIDLDEDFSGLEPDELCIQVSSYEGAFPYRQVSAKDERCRPIRHVRCSKKFRICSFTKQKIQALVRIYGIVPCVDLERCSDSSKIIPRPI